MEQDEQVGFRTLGWPANLQELALTVDFPNGMMEEISLARLSDLGGLSAQMVAQLQPLFATAFRHLWARTLGTAPITIERRQRLDDFAVGVLSPREAEVVQLILKGHSGLSISLTLKIALPTFHTVTFGGGGVPAFKSLRHHSIYTPNVPSIRSTTAKNWSDFLSP